MKNPIEKQALINCRRNARRAQKKIINAYISLGIMLTICLNIITVDALGLFHDIDYAEQYKKPAIERTINHTDTMSFEIAKPINLTTEAMIPIAQNIHDIKEPIHVVSLGSMNTYKSSEIVTTDYTVETPVNEEIREEAVETPVEEINDRQKDDPYFGWTEQDYNYLLGVIVGEAQNCSREEQMMVGSVVLNRLNNKKYFSYADSIEDIVMAPKQYDCFRTGTAYKEPTETNKEVTLELLKNGSILPGNVIFQALFPQGDGVYHYFEDTGTYICYKD